MTKLNRLLRKVTGVCLADASKAFKGKKGLISADGLPPIDAGYKRLGRTIYQDCPNDF